MIVILAAAVVALAGGFIVGVVAGVLVERERAARRHLPAPHEALAAEAIVLGLRGPLRSRPATRRPADMSVISRRRRRGPAPGAQA